MMIRQGISLVLAMLCATASAATTRGNDPTVYDEMLDLIDKYGIGEDETDEETVNRLLGVEEQQCRLDCNRPLTMCKRNCEKKFKTKTSTTTGTMMTMNTADEVNLFFGITSTDDMADDGMNMRRTRGLGAARTGRVNNVVKHSGPRGATYAHSDLHRNTRDLKGSGSAKSTPSPPRTPKPKNDQKARQMTKACNNRCTQTNFRCIYSCYPQKCRRECLKKVDRCLTRCDEKNPDDGLARADCRIKKCYKANKDIVNECLRDCNRNIDDESSVQSDETASDETPASLSTFTVSDESDISESTTSESF